MIMLRFAQVYPAYATHYDQPGRPKFIQPARLGRLTAGLSDRKVGVER